MKKTRILSLALSLALTATLSLPALAAEDSDRSTPDAAAALALQYGAATSVQYAVWEDGAITRSGGTGVYSKTENRALTEDILYGVGSVSKVYTTAAVMKLQEEGKVDLSKPVTTYLPDFQMADPRYKDITVGMLLNHSSGLPGSTVPSAFLINDPGETRATDDLLKHLSSETLKADPGAFSVYCNDGFTLAELVVEAASGQDFEDYLRSALLTPMGLGDTFASADEFDRSRMAKTYLSAEDTRALPPENVGVMGTGGIYATAADLAAFGGQLYQGGVLSAASLRAMTAPEYAKGIWPDDTEHSLSFGLGWDEVEAHPFAYSGIQALVKGGDTLLYHAHLLVLPEHKLSVAVLSSGGSSAYNGAAAARIALDVLKARGVAVDEAVKTLPTPKTVPMPKELTAMSGSYTSSTLPCTVDIAEDGTMTLATVYGQQSTTYREGGVFMDEKNTMALSFVTEENGTVYLHQKAYTDLPGLVQLPTSSYAYQRMPENPVSEEVQKAWDARNGKLYLMLNEKYTSMTYAVAMPVAAIATTGSVPGYMAFDRLVDADRAEGVAAIPGTAGRDWQNLTLHRDETEVEYLTVNGSLCMDAAAVTAVYPGNGVTTVGNDGYARWYLVGDAVGKTLSVTLPDHGGFAVYDAQGLPVAASHAFGDTSAVLPEGGYLVFAGDPGAQFTLSIS